MSELFGSLGQFFGAQLFCPPMVEARARSQAYCKLPANSPIRFPQLTDQLPTPRLSPFPKKISPNLLQSLQNPNQ